MKETLSGTYGVGVCRTHTHTHTPVRQLVVAVDSSKALTPSDGSGCGAPDRSHWQGHGGQGTGWTSCKREKAWLQTASVEGHTFHFHWFNGDCKTVWGWGRKASGPIRSHLIICCQPQTSPADHLKWILPGFCSASSFPTAVSCFSHGWPIPPSTHTHAPEDRKCHNSTSRQRRALLTGCPRQKMSFLLEPQARKKRMKSMKRTYPWNSTNSIGLNQFPDQTLHMAV